MNRIFVRVLPVFVLCALACATAAAEPVSLVYRPQVGTVVEHVTTGHGELEMAVLGEPLVVDAQVRTRQKVLAVDDKGVCTVEYSVTDGHITANKIDVELLNVGKKAIIRVAPDKRVIAVDKPIPRDPNAAGLDLAALMVRVTGGLFFPDHPIEVGDYWRRKVEVLGTDGEAISLDIRHQLTAIEERDGRKVALIESRVKIPTTITIITHELQGTVYVDGHSEVELETGETLKQVVDCKAVFKGAKQAEAYEATVKSLHVEVVLDKRTVEPPSVARAGEAITLAFRPRAGQALRYRVCASGIVDVTVLGDNQRLTGEIEVEAQVEPREDGVLLRYASADSEIQIGEAKMKVPQAPPRATLFDAQHRPVKVLPGPEGERAETSPVALFVRVLGAVAWPARPVAVGETWEENYVTEDVLGEKHRVTSRHTLLSLRTVGGELVATISSEINFPVAVRYKGFRLRGTASAVVESDVRVSDGVPIRQRAREVNCRLEPVDKSGKLRLSLRDLVAEFELLPAKEKSQALLAGS